jgi:hypothetical protein
MPCTPSYFINVLKGWGHMWIWKNLKVTGGMDWLAQAIAEGTLVAVTNGSYIQEHHPDLCLAAFVQECTQKRGRMVGSFPKASKAAKAFQGELLDLMAVHLLLLALQILLHQVLLVM